MTVTSSLRDCKNLEIYAARQRVRQRVTAREISLRLSARMITVAFFAQFHVKLDVPGAAWIRSFGRSARRRRTENGRRELSASRTCKRTFAFPTFVLGLPMPAYANSVLHFSKRPLHESRENEHGTPYGHATIAQRNTARCTSRLVTRSRQTSMKPRARALPRSSFSRNRGFYRFNNGRAACMEEPRAVSPRQRNASTQSVQKAATQWSLFRRDLIGQGFTKPFKRGRASPPPPPSPHL